MCPITCANGGVVDDGCRTCLCPANSGWYGPSCQNRYYDLNLTLSGVDASAQLADPVSLARFERTAATDLAVAAAVSTLSAKVSVAVVNVSAASASSVLLQVRFGLGYTLASSYDFQGAPISGATDPAFSVNPTALTSQTASLLALARAATLSGTKLPRDLAGVWALFATAVGDADSVLYQGVLTSRIARTVRITVTDPTGLDRPVQPALPQSVFVRAPSAPTQSASSGGASSASALAGLAALLALPVLAVVAFLACRQLQPEGAALLARRRRGHGRRVGPLRRWRALALLQRSGDGLLLLLLLLVVVARRRCGRCGVPAAVDLRLLRGLRRLRTAVGRRFTGPGGPRAAAVRVPGLPRADSTEEEPLHGRALHTTDTRRG